MRDSDAGLSGIRIVERSWLAKLAAKKLNAPRVAMVLGRTIHLSGVSRAQFLHHPAWVAHELAHVEQFRRYGTPRFVLLYLLESLLRGYHDNRFEVEARKAEHLDRAFQEACEEAGRPA